MKKRNLWKKCMALGMAGVMLMGLAACGSKTEEPAQTPEASEAPAAAAGQKDNTADENEQATTEENGGYTINFMLAQSSFKEEAHNAIKEKMKEMYDIDVEYEVIPDAQFTNLSQVRLSTGEAPDVIHVNVPGAYSTYDAANTLVALDDQPWMDRLGMDVDPLKDTDGKLYGMPITGFSGVMAVVYNKTVFKELGIEIPKTYDEFLKALDTVKNSGKDITPLYLSFKDTWTTQIGPMIYFANALNETGEDIYAKLNSNQMKFTDIPEYKQALSDFQKLFTEGYVNEDYIVGTYDTSKEEVATGKAAMIIQGEYAVNDIVANWPDAEIGMFPLPYNDVDKVMTAKYVYALAVPQEAENVDNSLDFINKLSQPEFLSLYLNANAVNSPFSDVTSDNVNPILQEMYDNYLNKGEYVVQVGDILSNFGSLNDDIIFPAYAQLALGEDVDGLIKQIDEGMQEYGKNLGLEGF
ncbi:ABC transporter substrate-binding protein [Diplocloster hominis]|uniref:ABC transporter substrate-binding protein n=1 Tax=Diplocloster hominis TaxID=3079010 RepID=UPI0031BBB6EB